MAVVCADAHTVLHRVAATGEEAASNVHQPAVGTAAEGNNIRGGFADGHLLGEGNQPLAAGQDQSAQEEQKGAAAVSTKLPDQF